MMDGIDENEYIKGAFEGLLNKDDEQVSKSHVWHLLAVLSIGTSRNNRKKNLLLFFFFVLVVVRM